MKPLKKAFAENCVKYEMDLSKAIDFECPVRMFHGKKIFETIQFT